MPTLIISYFVKQDALNLTTLTTPSFTPSVGEVIVVKGVTADGATPYGTPSDSQTNTYTSRKSSTSASFTPCYIWTAITGAATAMTVSLTPSGTNNWHSMVVERWSSASLAATPATNGTIQGTSTAPSSTITTTAANSVVSWCDGDWTATSGASRAYNTTSATPIEEGFTGGDTVNYTAYFAYQTATAAGSQTIGITTPTQKWTMVAIEILDAGVPPPVIGKQINVRGPYHRIPGRRRTTHGSTEIFVPPPEVQPFIGWGWGVNV